MKSIIAGLIAIVSCNVLAAEGDWNSAQYVFVARLTGVQAGPVAQSFPPIYNHTLNLTVIKNLRGELKAGDLTAHHSARQEMEPVFPVDKDCILAASSVRGGLLVTRIVEATPESLAEVTAAVSLPLGWTLQGGKPVSPWGSMGEKAWPADANDPAAKVVCSKTGRPAYSAGDVSFAVEKVPPKKDIKWTNPDGDGEYTITVTNNSDKPVIVPALLTIDGKVAWEESLVILCQKKAYMCPGAKGVSGKIAPTTLEPRQSLSTVVNALRLEGPEWPKGGYRIEFQFCLGEKSVTQSFYYMSRHHDPLREAAKKLN